LKNEMTLSFVAKRNGSITPFDEYKIRAAITKAGVHESYDLDRIVEYVIELLQKYEEIVDNSCVSIETIQDCVEQSLMEHGLYDVAKRYILYRDERRKARVETETNYRLMCLK